MDRFIVKNLILCGFLIGLLFGLLSVVPFISLFLLLAVLFISAPCVMTYLIMAGKYDITDEKNAIISGAVVGFSANITYAGAFCLLTVILSLIFGYNPNFVLTAMIIHSPIWLLILCILFVGVVTATTNAFSGFLTYYIINFIRDYYARKHGE